MNILRPLTPHVAVAHRSRGDRGDVGAGVGFGDRDRRDLLAGDRGPQVALLLIVGAELGERRRGHVGLHRQRHRDRAAPRLGELLDEHDLGGEIATRAAPLDGVVQAEEAELAGASEHVVGEPARVFPFLDVRSQLGVDEATHRAPQLLVLGGEDRMQERRHVE